MISDAETHVKMACGDKKAAFRVALLDPALTVTQPARDGADGHRRLGPCLGNVCHLRRKPLSLRLAARRGYYWRRKLRASADDPPDLEARAGMHWAPVSPAWPLKIRCSGPLMLWPIR